MPVKQVIQSKTLVKIWTDDLEDAARKQLSNMSRLPFIHKHIAVMPDVHWGCGATIGSVIPSIRAIVPASVGVDIGCGMIATMTSLVASDLPDNLHSLRTAIESAIPHGRSDNGGASDKGGFHSFSSMPKANQMAWHHIDDAYRTIIDKNPRAKAFNTWEQLGTLGTGNHFIEVCLDEQDCVWVVLHSGSRGVGNKIGAFFIDKAKEYMAKHYINLVDPNLAYLVKGTPLFEDYWFALSWAQEFAAMNRELMMGAVVKVLSHSVRPTLSISKTVNCHHNYVAIENHFDKNVFVTRKGAIRARVKDWGIIPGSMGAATYIVQGKGNKDSFCSCSHGAGRRMSRAEAKRRYSAEDLAKQTIGVECPKDSSRVDEIPSAYKDIDEVMANQSDLVEVLHTLHQVVNVKG